jgi:hypothetical protein
VRRRDSEMLYVDIPDKCIRSRRQQCRAGGIEDGAASREERHAAVCSRCSGGARGRASNE